MMTTWSTFTHKESGMKDFIKLKRVPVYAEGALFDGTEEGAERVAKALSHHGVKYVGYDGFWDFTFSHKGLDFTVEKDHYIVVEEGLPARSLGHKGLKMIYDFIGHGDYGVERDFYEKLCRVEDGMKIPKGTRYVRVYKDPVNKDTSHDKTFIEVAEHDICVPLDIKHTYYTFEEMTETVPEWKDSPAILAYCKNCSPEAVYLPHPKWVGDWQCTSCGMSWAWHVLKDVKPLRVETK